MEEVNKELYWAASKAFELLSINEKTRFLNNMKDQMCKRGDVKLENEFLVVIPKEDTHIIPIKYTQDTHYATLILKRSEYVKIDFDKDRRERFTITGNQDQTPVELIIHNTRCWMKQAELDVLLVHNIDIDKIKIVTYREGLVSPYGGINSPLNRKCVDAYELEFIW